MLITQVWAKALSVGLTIAGAFVLILLYEDIVFSVKMILFNIIAETVLLY